MAEARPRGVASRIKGQYVIRRGVIRLVIRTGRYLQFRARTDAERRWAQRLLDALQVAARAAEIDNAGTEAALVHGNTRGRDLSSAPLPR
jgi:hypothetical protein